MAGSDGADVRRDAAPIGRRDRRRSPPAGLRRHHAAERQADDLPDDSTGRADHPARRHPREPLWYKHEYLRRLNQRIGDRLEGLRSGRIRPDELLVHGSRQLLEQLSARGLTLYLASGTDEPFVKAEAELLDVARYFGPRIYGAQDDYQNFSKQMVIDRILRDHAISGERLLAFGDGYVEIENTKGVGGLAVAVASDEANNGSGRMDPWKRQRLLGVGADVVIPDFRDAEASLSCLTGARFPCPVNSRMRMGGKHDLVRHTVRCP